MYITNGKDCIVVGFVRSSLMNDPSIKVTERTVISPSDSVQINRPLCTGGNSLSCPITLCIVRL